MIKSRPDFILRLIVIEKTILSTLAIFLSAAVLSLINRDLEAIVRRAGALLGLNADNRFLILTTNLVTDTQSSTLIMVSVIGFGYAAMNLLEAYGLAMRYRWAEYFTVVATAAFIPFEIHELYVKPGPLGLFALIINVLIVLFLARHKELFPKRLKIFAIFHRTAPPSAPDDRSI